jgi:hypothetical protein
LADPIRYALTRWEGLSAFLDDGRVELDTNTVERSIRPLALNRNYALFAGSDEGDDNWAVTRLGSNLRPPPSNQSAHSCSLIGLTLLPDRAGIGALFY